MRTEVIVLITAYTLAQGHSDDLSVLLLMTCMVANSSLKRASEERSSRSIKEVPALLVLFGAGQGQNVQN